MSTPATQPGRRTPVAAPTQFTLLTLERNPATGVRSFEARAGERVVGTVTWRDFATDSGWQFRFPNDRRTLRKVFATMVDAMVNQGGCNRAEALEAVAANPAALRLAQIAQAAA